MLNKLQAFLRRYQLAQPGDTITCAVSGGADSMALLWAMYLLREKLKIQLHAAHFNHGLRGEESDRDAAFVEQFCKDYHIPFYLGSGKVVPGEKGLEAAARNARYAFLETLPGKIATAHTADDNAETLLMHLVRGTGLKGLGGITPVRGKVIRPMLNITRQEVLTFLQMYSIPYVEDSTNKKDDFLRNRLRHRVMPLLAEENPRIAQNLSALARTLREDEEQLSQSLPLTTDVQQLRKMLRASRSRVLAQLLQNWGVKEPEKNHIALLEQLVFSDNPSAKASFPGNVEIGRVYDHLQKMQKDSPLQAQVLPCPGSVLLKEQRVKITCRPADEFQNSRDCFTVCPQGDIMIRSRQAGDIICLPGGSKTLKKLFIDRKIPASQRDAIAVLCDSKGILGVHGIGPDIHRLAQTGGVEIRFETIT